MSGENVYGVVESLKSDPKMLIIKNPLIWEDYDTPDGYTGSALVKFMAGTSESSIPISISSIVSIANMSPEFSKFYDAAVSVQKITDEAYAEKLLDMTRRMKEMIAGYNEKAQAASFGRDALVAFPLDTEDTIH
jgi:hypothetical protein